MNGWVEPLLAAAARAPSGDNTQPWRFTLGEDDIGLYADRSRWLRVADPDRRELHISLGCALENLLIAARAWGQHPTVRYLPWGTTPRPGTSLAIATVTWQPGERARDRLLHGMLVERRSNPRSYDGRAITIPWEVVRAREEALAVAAERDL